MGVNCQPQWRFRGVGGPVGGKYEPQAIMSDLKGERMANWIWVLLSSFVNYNSRLVLLRLLIVIIFRALQHKATGLKVNKTNDYYDVSDWLISRESA